MNYRWLPLILCFAAATQGQEAPKNVASVLQPYVDQHKLAGAVTLVLTPFTPVGVPIVVASLACLLGLRR